MRPVAIYDEPPNAPHICIKCRAHAQVREWFVDTGAEAEWEGYVYFCNSCMFDIVKATPDFMTVASHKEVVSEFTGELNEYAILKDRIRSMDETWENLTGKSLEEFFDHLEKIKLDHERLLRLSTTVSSPTGDLSTAFDFPTGPKSNNSNVDRSSSSVDSTVQPDIIVFQ